MMAAGLARAQRGRQGPHRQAMGEDLARARQPGRRRTISKRPNCRSRSTSSGSTSSATAARPASAIRARSRRRSRRRSPSTIWSPRRCCRATAISRAASIPDVRANYLASPPLVVAYALAGSMQVDLDPRPARQRQAGQAGLSRRHLAEDRGGARPRRRDDHRQDVQDEIRERVRRRRELAQGQGGRRATPTPGTWARPMSRTRPISRA